VRHNKNVVQQQMILQKKIYFVRPSVYVFSLGVDWCADVERNTLKNP